MKDKYFLERIIRVIALFFIAILLLMLLFVNFSCKSGYEAKAKVEIRKLQQVYRDSSKVFREEPRDERIIYE